MGNFIPIERVGLRRDHLKYQNNVYGNSYPLYESYNKKDSYNFLNLAESLYNWTLYSQNAGDNLKQVIDILETISENGTKNQLFEATDIVNKSITPYLESPLFFKRLVDKRMHRGNMNMFLSEALDLLKKEINEQSECDRVLNNHKIVSKRFNIDKVVSSNIYYEDAFTETMYTLCSLIDTYNMDIKSKFCSSAELAMYCINECGERIDNKKLLETIIDYYLINYGVKDLDQFTEDIKFASDRDNFIDSNIVYEYLDYVNDVNKKLDVELQNFDEEVLKHYRDSDIPVEETSEMLSGSLQFLCEVAFLDKAKEVITKIKLAPIKTINMVKEAIRALIVPTRLQDLKQGTHNALSLIFYAAIIIGCVPFGGPIGMVLGMVSSCIIAKHANKQYLKDSIQEWREHKYSVERKIKDCTDGEKKRKLQEYLTEVEKNIEILEKEYEKVRDRTSIELASDNEKRMASPDYNIKSSMINPLGQSTVANPYQDFIDKASLKTTNSDNSSSSNNSTPNASNATKASNSNTDDDNDEDVQAYINKIKSE